MKRIVIHILCALCLFGCAERSGVSDGSIVVRLSALYANAPSAAPTDAERIELVKAYLCSDGVVQKIFEMDKLSDLVIEERYHFANSTLYVVANPASCAALGGVMEQGSESGLADLEIAGDIKKVVLGGVVDLSGKSGQAVDVMLERSVARFDLVVEPNRGIEVEAVIFDSMPSKGRLFGVMSEHGNRSSYRMELKTSTSIDGLTYSYPLPSSASGAQITLDVRYDGNLATLIVPIREIKRNYAYNLNVYAYSGRVTATLDASSMEEGDTTTGVVGYQHTVIKKETTTLCDGAKIISPTMVQMPNVTSQITLGLSGNYDKTVTLEGDTTQFIVKRVEGRSFQNDQLTVSVERNKAYGYGGRAVILCVSHVEGGHTITDRISLTQTAPEPFPIVTIGGLEWMSLNAIGRDLSKYNSLAPGQTLRQMLNANWQKYGGACYQWGPRETYHTLAPWDLWAVLGGSFGDKNGPIINMPSDSVWQGETVPCPDGWRLPTYEECARIWPPNGKQLPITYTNNGTEYTMTLEPTGATLFVYIHNDRKLHNVVISDGENELIFPAGGVRHFNNADQPGKIFGYGSKIGSAFALRTQKSVDKNGNSAGIGLARQFNNDADLPYTVNTRGTSDWTGGTNFCNIRCVREIQK